MNHSDVLVVGPWPGGGGGGAGGAGSAGAWGEDDVTGGGGGGGVGGGGGALRRLVGVVALLGVGVVVERHVAGCAVQVVALG